MLFAGNNQGRGEGARHDVSHLVCHLGVFTMLNIHSMKFEHFARPVSKMASIWNSFQDYVVAKAKALAGSTVLMLFFCIEILVLALFGAKTIIFSAIVYLAVIGLPIVMLVRHMMKRRDAGQSY